MVRCTCVEMNSRVVQQQDDGVELFPGPVISSERHYEVVEAVPCSLSRHYDEFVFKTIRLSILEAVVPAALHKRREKQTVPSVCFHQVKDRECKE